MAVNDPAQDQNLDKSGAVIRDMFAKVARRYDLLNHLLSGALDFWWRRQAARALAPRPGEEVLDLCCGTGDQAVVIEKRGARVVAADFCLPMLAIAQGKLVKTAGPPRLATADALQLPFVDGRFDGATVSFGLRNVADLDRSLRELLRVLKPGGRLVVLDASIPTLGVVRGPYLFYFNRILPWVGRLISDCGPAYSYLPKSVASFPLREAFSERLRAAGFATASWRSMTAGTVCLYVGRKAP